MVTRLKHLDTGKVIVILAVYYSILELKLNDEYELKAQTFSFTFQYTDIAPENAVPLLYCPILWVYTPYNRHLA